MSIMDSCDFETRGVIDEMLALGIKCDICYKPELHRKIILVLLYPAIIGSQQSKSHIG